MKWTHTSNYNLFLLITRLLSTGFFLFITSVFVMAQNPYHKVYGLNDGLPSDELYDIHVAKNNLLWIATDRGICTFDGYDFEVFSTKEGLAYPTNFKIIPDQFDRLWFNGFDGSLSYFANDSFYRATHNESLKQHQRHGYNNNVGVDSIGQVFTHQLHLSFSDEKPVIYKMYDKTGVSLVAAKFDTLGMSVEDNIILEKYTFENTAFYRITQRDIYLDAIVELSPNKYLFAINGTVNRRLKKLQKAIPSVTELFILENGGITKIRETNEEVRSIYKDNDGNIHFATSKGLLFFRNGDLLQTPELFFDKMDFTCIDQDLGGNYWAGTKTGLLYIPTFDFRPIVIKSYDRGIIRKIGTLDEHLLINTEYASSYFLDENLKPSLPFDIPTFNNGFYFKIGNHLVLFGGGRLITEKKGELAYFGERYSVIRNRKGESKMSIQPYENMAISAELDLLKKVDSIYRVQDGPISKINSVAIGNKNDIWLGTMSGLYVFEGDRIERLVFISDSVELLRTRVSDVKLNNKGHAWVATVGNGLVKLTDNKQVCQISEQDGLSSDLINQLFIENDTIIWVCTNKGLDKLTVSDDRNQPVRSIIKYNNTDGLPSNFVYDFTLWKNKYWVATSKGLYHFDKDTDVFQKKKPTLEILNVEVEDDSTYLQEGGQLQFDQNYLTFNFRGISYRKPKEGFYQYKLKRGSEDGEWLSTDTRSVRFTNLDAGNYTFYLKARNKYNVWSEEVTFEFGIRPHFTSAWWFLVLCVFILLGLVTGLYFWRLKNLVKENNRQRILAEARLKTEIAELTTFRNQFNPHFVFNALNSIQNFIFKNDPLQAGKFLSKFSKLIRESLNLTSEKYVTIAREFKFLASYLALEQLRFPEKFDFDIKNDENIPLDLYLMPSLIMQPVIENVLKHAFNDKNKGVLSIRIMQHTDANALRLIIKDNGAGINIEGNQDKKTERKSFGLKLITERIELLKLEYPDEPSSFEIRNRVGEDGTIAEFIIPKIYKNADAKDNSR